MKLSFKLIILLIFLSYILQVHAQTGTTYIYDDLNRLTQVTYSNGTTISYTYDALGNRLSKTVTAAVSSQLPTVITANVSQVSGTTATCGGNVTSDGGANVTARGVCWSTSHNPTTSNSHTTDGTGTGSFTSSITGLTPGTTYFVRAYATNAEGTAYGNEVSFTTSCGDVNVAISGSSTVNYGQSVTLTASGASTYIWSTGQTGSSITVTPNATTTYSVTGTDVNGCIGIATKTVTVIPQLAVVSTANATQVSATSATCSGNVASDGGDPVYERGICWSTSHNPTVAGSHLSNGTGTGSFTINLTGLSPATTYYVRAYAKNSVGTAYGGEIAFFTTSTSSCGTLTVSDYDGNIYNTVPLGTQCWMKQNMKTTHYSDGTFILLGGGVDFGYGCRYYPNNNSNNVASLGYLYNWTAAMHGAVSSDSVPSGVQGVCPIGWHIPSKSEVSVLLDYMNSQNQYHCNNENYSIGKALASTESWANSSTICAIGNNPSDNNSSHFSAIPAGAFIYQYSGIPEIGMVGLYSKIDSFAVFWMATEYDGSHAYNWLLSYDYPSFGQYGVPMYNYSAPQEFGFSVRCLKNEMEPSTTYSLPTITTDNLSNITTTTATSGGNVISDGGAFVIAKGICWSTSPNPTTSDSHTNDGTSTGVFNSSITGLLPNTTYYVRAYAINLVGTAYGNELSFHTTCNQAIDIAGATNICQGQSTTLTACCGTQYSWNTGEQTAAISVSPSQTTTYTVTVTDTYGCQSSLSTTIVVDSIPVITCSLPAHLCWNSASVVLNDYASVSNNPNAQLTFTGYGVSNGIFYPSSTYYDVTTFITVSYQDPTTGCWANTVVDSITTHSSTEITLNYPVRDTICQNEVPLHLSGSLPEGGHYSGNYVDSATSTFNPPFINSTENTMIFYEFTNQYGCYSNASFVLVVVPTTPINLHADSIIYPNGTYVVSAYPSGGTLTLDNQLVPHWNNQPDEYPNTYQIVSNDYSLGQHELTYSLDDYCHSSFSQQITIINPDFVEEIDGVSVSIRPNPTTNKTIVSWKNAEAAKLCLYDIAGKLIMTQKDLYGQSAELDLSPYATGVYFVCIHWKDGHRSNTYKIVKE